MATSFHPQSPGGDSTSHFALSVLSDAPLPSFSAVTVGLEADVGSAAFLDSAGGVAAGDGDGVWVAFGTTHADALK